MNALRKVKVEIIIFFFSFVLCCISLELHFFVLLGWLLMVTMVHFTDFYSVMALGNVQ